MAQESRERLLLARVARAREEPTLGARARSPPPVLKRFAACGLRPAPRRIAGCSVAQRLGLSAAERQQQVSPRPEISEKGFAGKMGAVREGVTFFPALHPLRFTFGSSGHAELLGRWRVEVSFPV